MEPLKLPPILPSARTPSLSPKAVEPLAARTVSVDDAAASCRWQTSPCRRS